jgi:hypothetical protein
VDRQCAAHLRRLLRHRFLGEQWIPSGLASVLFATFPLWTVLLGPLLLPGERISWRSATGALVGFAGVALIYARDLAPVGGKAALAGAVFLVSPVLSAIANLLTKRFGKDVHPLSITRDPDAARRARRRTRGAAHRVARSGGVRRSFAARPGVPRGRGLGGGLQRLLLAAAPVERAQAGDDHLHRAGGGVVVGAVLFGEPLGWSTVAGGALVLAVWR